MGPFAKKCALALALAPLGTFMLSAYLDFIDIANFIFLVRGKEIRGERGATPGGVVQRSRADIMGDRASNDTPSNRQLENRRVNAAGIKAPGSKCVAIIGRRRRRRREERERDRSNVIVYKKLLPLVLYFKIFTLYRWWFLDICKFFSTDFYNTYCSVCRVARNILRIIYFVG